MMIKSGYEILQFSLLEGWVNNLYDSYNMPYVFESLEEAVEELQGEFDTWKAEIECGARAEEEGYDINTFKIIHNTHSVEYDLARIEGTVKVLQESSYT